MKDKAGTVITVGCRVAEADFTFGDGTVESITVPVTGDGYNVGVHWDEPDKGGPGWSDEGGGRSAEHLLVIEAAQTERPPREFQEWELKKERFKQRFHRSPTPSQAELSAADWDELDEEEGEVNGGSGGSEGGSEGGENGGNNDREGGEPDVDAILASGRICMAFGSPAKWTGGMVGTETDKGIAIGFDDGEIRRYNKEQLVDRVKAKVLKAADPAHGGLVENESGAMAARFFEYKDKVIGLFVGEEDNKLCSELPIYQDIHIQPGAFAPPARASRSGGQTAQDRYGLYTFRRADMVEYLNPEEGESYTAAVFGIIYHEPEDEQARKMLVLYDVRADYFFVGNWPAWRRMPKDGVVDFDRMNDEHALTLSYEQCVKMATSFRSCALIKDMDTVRKAIRQAGEAPPALKWSRVAAQKEREAAEAEERARQKAEERAAREAAKAAARAAGKGKGRGRGPGRGKGGGGGTGGRGSDGGTSGKGGSGKGGGGAGSDGEEWEPYQPPDYPPYYPPYYPSPAPYYPSPAPSHVPPHAPLHAPPWPQPQPQQDDSPPGSVRALKKQVRGLKAAQFIPGQEPSAMAARAQIDGLECELEERERKFRKYRRW